MTDHQMERTRQFEEMLPDLMKLARKRPQELTVKECNVLFVGYKSVIRSRRAAWRAATNVLDKQRQKSCDHDKLAIVQGYKVKMEAELLEICNRIIALLDAALIPQSTCAETTVFYYKLKGDYCRYLSEIQVTDEDAHRQVVDAASDAYTSAAILAFSHLAPTHPNRLGLVLNLAVFYYEILNSPERACKITKEALDDAMAELGGLTEGEQAYRDATLILKLLQDNLTLWTSSAEQTQPAERAGSICHV